MHMTAVSLADLDACLAAALAAGYHVSQRDEQEHEGYCYYRLFRGRDGAVLEIEWGE